MMMTTMMKVCRFFSLKVNRKVGKLYSRKQKHTADVKKLAFSKKNTHSINCYFNLKKQQQHSLY